MSQWGLRRIKIVILSQFFRYRVCRLLKHVQNILEIQEVFGPVVHAATFDIASSEAKSKWYFVTKIVLTYCEKKVF